MKIVAGAIERLLPLLLVALVLLFLFRSAPGGTAELVGGGLGLDGLARALGAPF